MSQKVFVKRQPKKTPKKTQKMVKKKHWPHCSNVIWLGKQTLLCIWSKNRHKLLKLRVKTLSLAF